MVVYVSRRENGTANKRLALKYWLGSCNDVATGRANAVFIIGFGVNKR